MNINKILSNNGRWPVYNQLDNMILSPLYKSHANALIIYTKLVTMTPKVSARWRGFVILIKLTTGVGVVMYSLALVLVSIVDLIC